MNTMPSSALERLASQLVSSGHNQIDPWNANRANTGFAPDSGSLLGPITQGNAEFERGKRELGFNPAQASNYANFMQSLYDAGKLTPEQAAAYERNTRDDRMTIQPVGPMIPFADAQPQGPQYGLSGAEAATMTGLQSSLAALDRGVEESTGAIRGAQQTLNPYIQGGGQASRQMAALSGAAGPEAQAQAYEDYRSSPGYQWAFDEAMRGVSQNAAAAGNLDSGNHLKALQNRAAGLAAQDYGNQFNRLASTSQQGLQGNQINAGLGQTLANLYGNAGGTAVNAFAGAGNNLANMRYGTGLNIANLTSNTANANADATNQYGINLNNLMNTTGTNMSNLLTGGNIANANQLTNLATLLANLSQGLGSGQAQIDTELGRSDAAGIVDSAAGVRKGTGMIYQMAQDAANGLAQWYTMGQAQPIGGTTTETFQ